MALLLGQGRSLKFDYNVQHVSLKDWAPFRDLKEISENTMGHYRLFLTRPILCGDKSSDCRLMSKGNCNKIHRILPTSMEVSTATNSACTAKFLIVSQAVGLLRMMNWLQWRSPQMWAMSYGSSTIAFTDHIPPVFP